MNILITGGLGHIGSYLVRHLGSVMKVDKIIVLDSLRTQRFSSLFGIANDPKVFFLEMDCRYLKLSDLEKYGDIDYIIHLAAINDALASFDSREELFDNNINSTKNLIDISIALGARLIFPSSTSIYESQVGLVDESCDQFFPRSPYAECKLQEENLIINFRETNLERVILRLGTIHGVSPGMRFHTAVNKFCYQFATGVPLTVWKTALYQSRPYLSLIDASNAIAHVISNDLFSGEIYNVVTAHRTVFEVIDTIQKLSSKRGDINFIESQMMSSAAFEVSNLKIQKTGFLFSGSLEVDITDTLKLLSGVMHD